MTLGRGLNENFFSLGSLFSRVDEVYSEKQRRWACAQGGDKFKGKRSLTKTQAKEMCSSEIKEVITLDEEEKINLDYIRQEIQKALERSAVSSGLVASEEGQEEFETAGPEALERFMELISTTVDNIEKEKQKNIPNVQAKVASQLSAAGLGEMIDEMSSAGAGGGAPGSPGQGRSKSPWIKTRKEQNYG